MRSLAVARLLPLVFAAAAPAWAHRPWPAPLETGGTVALSVQVDGATVPLYAATDGSGRRYVEARRGARYTLRLVNRTGERVAALITVDGLNVISGERQPVTQRGRMYVLDPWESADIQGWRTSLDDVRRFTFVDEQASYAARAGKATARMGWIEMAVYRERQRYTWRSPDVTTQDAPSAGAPTPALETRSREEGAAKAQGRDAESGARRSYPGTGWGERVHDSVRLVDFEPEAHPAERITVRYEYASALRALGILPWQSTRDRLRERERGQAGFAQPPE
ncbi:MAG TPA: hypothetical protein VFO85_14965 [Vicinamibacteria bacterium]|nr:hypothetical protein [Vicinamibacteria bacterium]